MNAYYIAIYFKVIFYKNVITICRYLHIYEIFIMIFCASFSLTAQW